MGAIRITNGGNKKGNKTMVLGHDEMKKVFEDLGFEGFCLREYDMEMEGLLSYAAEDNAKAYSIDVVPGGLENGRNDGIALMEKHHYQKNRFQRLCEKWNEIIIHFSCYYPLKSVFVSGMGLPSDGNFAEKTPNQDGYILEFPLESISDMDRFIGRVFQKTYGTLRFWFPTLQMVFHYFRDDVYLTVSLKNVTEENQAAIELLRKLVEAQGLFLL